MRISSAHRQRPRVVGLAVRRLDADAVARRHAVAESPARGARWPCVAGGPMPTITAPKAALGAGPMPRCRRRSTPSAAPPRRSRPARRKSALTSLQYAAEHGHGVALWKLGRMYADGDGVVRDDHRAFEYFQKFADSHADDNPATPRARFVANAFVALGHYYLDGIPNSAVEAEPGAGAPDVLPCGVLFRRSGGAVSARPALPRRQRRRRATPSARCRGSCSPPTRATTSRRRCSAASCSTASTACASAPSGLMWLTVASDGPGAKVALDRASCARARSQQATDDERGEAR